MLAMLLDSCHNWPSLLRKSAVELQVLLLQMKVVLGLYEELMQWSRLWTHFCRRRPMKSCRPMRAKTLRQKTVRIITSASFLTDWIRAPTIVFRPGWRRYGKKKALNGDVPCSGKLITASPGMTEMVFKARSTLKVLNAETFPRSTNSVTYLEFDTESGWEGNFGSWRFFTNTSRKVQR